MIQTILHLSDTHGLHRQLHALPDADVLVHSGDFTMAGTEEEAFDFIEWLASLPHPHKIFITGNHDDCLYQAQLEGLPEHVHYLCNSGMAIEVLHFYGMPMFVGDDLTGAYEQHIHRIPPDTDILISHQPPLGIRDFSGNIHWGNYALLQQITRIKPRIHLFGHIHDARGIEEVDSILYANSALVNDRYELTQEPGTLIHL